MNKIFNLISEYFVHLGNIKIIQKVFWNFTPYEMNYVRYNY